ncbi:hypothetical protein A7X81_08195 [Campylobacter ornithocola]|uniref:Uncharacterized protein n=1 Tax=Campylobacter ornithocola TaxID=1848766 RepID=A0A6M8MH37_9BACT|nr:hypothetical protein [Campylobacter ornithocola]OCX43213.1 hypothetical protein A7X81_08195 [Campylobacter ornithocola]QKF56880.1 hypothetical protein CORN_0317 [Campylobacter ornithocola]
MAKNNKIEDNWVIIRKISEVKNTEKDDFNQIGMQISVYVAPTEQLALQYLTKQLKGGSITYGITSYCNFKQKTNSNLIQDEKNGNKGHYIIDTIKLSVLNNIFSNHKIYNVKNSNEKP